MTDELLDVVRSAHLDDLEAAWGIIANAHEGRWDEASPEWRAAAERWRDEVWHPALDRYFEETSDPPH